MNWEDVDKPEMLESATLALCIGGVFAAIAAVMMAQDLGTTVCTASTAFDEGCAHTVRAAARRHAVGWGVVGVASGVVWQTEAWEMIT